MVRRWYQTIEIDGEGQVFEDINRKDSAFWNEGKWNNFINPLLPKEKQTFIEIGCNAGLFLKVAEDEGFRDVIGVEGNSQIFQQAQKFKEISGGNYKLAHQVVGKNFALDDLPIADVVLISNMHYYLPVGVFSKLVDGLRNRALYCIVVSAKAKRRRGNALYDLNSVRGYFRDWCEIGTIEDVDKDSDCCPREQMYGVLFRGNLNTLDVSNYYGAWWEASKNPKHKSNELAPVMRNFFRQVLDGGQIIYEDTEMYKYWRKREPRKPPEWTRNWLIYKENLAKDVQENGIKEPIYLDQIGKLLDGIHRLTLANLLEYEHVLVRRIR